MRVDLMPVDVSPCKHAASDALKGIRTGTLIVSDSFVNMAALAIYPGDSHRAYTIPSRRVSFCLVWRRALSILPADYARALPGRGR